MNYNQYIAQVIDEDGEEFNIKTFAVTMQEALDFYAEKYARKHFNNYGE